MWMCYTYPRSVQDIKNEHLFKFRQKLKERIKYDQTIGILDRVG